MTNRLRRMKASSIDCWMIDAMASAGAAIGWIWHATEKPADLEGDGAIGNVWRYRDWVIDAFNSNMPYDRFVILQLAGGDEHSQTKNNYAPDVQGLIPTGFLRVAPWDRSNLVAAEVRQNYLSEVTSTTGSVFLGSDGWLCALSRSQVRSNSHS